MAGNHHGEDCDTSIRLERIRKRPQLIIVGEYCVHAAIAVSSASCANVPSEPEAMSF